MKRTITPLLLAAAVLSGAACSRDSLSPEAGLTPADASGKVPILFTSEGLEAEVLTKATAVTTASLTAFNITATTGTAGNATAEKAAFTNAPFTGTTGGDFTGGKYWPSTTTSYHFYASNYPQSFVSGACTVEPEDNGTDIVCVYVASPTYKAKTALTFKHIYARIGTCDITAPTGYTVSALSVKITPDVGGTYNIRTGNGKTDGTGWSSRKAGGETVLATGTGSTADNALYLVPGSYELTAEYTLSKGDFTKSYTKTASVSLVGGKVNNIAATLPDAGDDISAITFTVSVTAWGSNSITATFN